HGASVAYHLTRRGAGRVVLVERKFLASGPTGRSSALVRRFYALDFLTRTASASADVFQHWSETIGGGDPGFRKVGVLWLAAPERAAHLRGNVERARELGVPGLPLAPAAVSRLVPAVSGCPGLRADRLLAPLGIEVPVAPKRHQMCFFRRPPGFATHPAVLDRPQFTYMRPETGNLTIHGLVAYDEIVDPDRYNEGA